MPIIRILGIDPGTSTMGFGVVDVDVTGDCCPKAGAYGVIKTTNQDDAAIRLLQIATDLRQLMADLEPDYLSIEKLFFFRNVTSVIGVAQARGVALLAAAEAGLTIAEYTPMEVKKAVAGHGHAEKIDVQETVQMELGLKSIPRPDDAADALALALCHMQYLRLQDYSHILTRTPRPALETLG